MIDGFRLKQCEDKIANIFENPPRATTPSIHSKKLIYEWVKNNTIGFGEFEYLLAFVDLKKEEESYDHAN